MTKYYFFILGIFCGLYGNSQICDSPNLLGLEKNWSGHHQRFAKSPQDEWRLQDSTANTSSIDFRPDSVLTGFQISFSLDFPPSASNRFELTIDLRSIGSTDTASISMIIGEAGSQDGVQVAYRFGDHLVNEHHLWAGDYGMGADRTSWDFSLDRAGFYLQNIGTGKREFISWMVGSAMDFTIAKIGLRCVYTRTRANHFTFHHLYGGSIQTGAVLEPFPGDVFISEWRLRPGAPENFIELYSTLEAPGCLNGLRLEVNGENVDLPSINVEPGHHIVVLDRDSPVNTNPGVRQIPVALPNIEAYSEVEVILYLFDRILHGVRGRLSEAPGNFQSIEMMDVSQPCRTDNWAISTAELGTPGTENSWFTTLDRPSLAFSWQTPMIAAVRFPYLVLDPKAVEQLVTANFAFVVEENTLWGEPRLVFMDEMSRLDTVQVRVEGFLSGCKDGDFWDTSFVSLPPVRGQEESLLITEIMYEPSIGCPEYLEITNLEDSDTWWDGLVIQKNDGEGLSIPVRGGWPSHQSRLYTKDRVHFLDCYPEALPALVNEVNLFALNNEGAELVLSANDPVRRIIDQISYSPNAHNYLIRQTAGVVLERNILGTQGNKWRSGFVQLGYRSPGFLPVWDLAKGIEIDFSSSVIYTATDREPSRLEISVGSENLDGSITIEIFDLNGRKIQTLANAVPVQGGEVFTWEGRSPQGYHLPEGLYLFWIYYFDLIGHKKTIKKTCVLSNN